LICLLVTTAMIVIFVKYRRDMREMRRDRASNARVLREFKRMAVNRPEQIVDVRREHTVRRKAS